MIDAKGDLWRRCTRCGRVAWAAPTYWLVNRDGSCCAPRRDFTHAEEAAFLIGGYSAVECLPLQEES